MAKSPRRAVPLLKCWKPAIKERGPVARPPVNPVTNPFYTSDHWKALRQATLQRDHYTCCIEGCCNRATIADHRTPRRHGSSKLPFRGATRTSVRAPALLLRGSFV
jgi:hypothetical protein